MAKAILTIRTNGDEHKLTFDSPDEAVDYGLQGLLSKKFYPLMVTCNGRTVASEGDFFILWEEEKRLG